jgi:hypothetical protein
LNKIANAQVKAQKNIPTPTQTKSMAAVPTGTRIIRRGDPKRVLILGARLRGLVAGYELSAQAITLPPPRSAKSA